MEHWVTAAIYLIRETIRYSNLSAEDFKSATIGGYYRDYFLNCSAENARHALRMRQKLHRHLKQQGLT
jgi:hypothetical protein